MKQNNHGEYTEVEEKDVLDITTNTTYVVVHFFSPTFKRCKIMDEHLEILSKKHYRARFMKTNAEKCAFLVAKLQIKVLPFVMCFVRGVVTERLIGFEKLNNSDTFSTAKLENLLIKSGVITKKVEVKNDSDEERFQKRGIRSSTKAIGLDEEY
ncbi:thioredoxin-like protein [Neoconidiobolus thromboides FSU 785]|nr:thioredoxin-like protein [Neoconidiobolus thromboides FSU 785]